MRFQALAIFVFSALPLALFAQTPQTPKFRTITVDCWDVGFPNFCPGSALDPFQWQFGEFNVSAPWSTRCDYQDPLPPGSSVISAGAIPWSQYCGSDDVGVATPFHLRLDGEDGETPASGHDEGEHCRCNSVTGSFVTFTGGNYKPGDTNTLELFGDGGGFNTLRVYRVDLTLTYVEAAPYYVELGLSTDPGLPDNEETKTTSGGTVTANVSLGSVFAIKLVKKSTESGISTVVPLPSSYAVADKLVAPALETDHNLFDQDTAISLSGGVGNGTESSFVAVHLGTMTLKVLPLTEAGVRPITVKLNIIRPSWLGGSYNEWDARIIDAAHERGIPPQILKGQIRA